MINSKFSKLLLEYLEIILGVTIMSASINMFFDPNGLVVGGVSGLGIIIQAVSADYLSFTIPIWLTNLIFNVPLFIIGAKVLGFRMVRRTIFSTLWFSFSLIYTSFLPRLVHIDYLLIGIFGGIIEGAGLGLVFRRMSTTGGSDLAASIIHKYNKHIAVSKIMFIVDSVIILLGMFTFGINNALYAIITAFIIAKTISVVLEGLSFSKAVFIISNDSDTVAERLLNDLNRGATGLYGKGMFTKQDRNVILCVVSTKELVKLKDLVKEVDPQAFVIVADVREVLGEGFEVI